MKSRFTVATVMGLLSLVLIGLLAHGLHEESANAQKLDFGSDDQPPIAATPPSAFSNSNRVPPTESRFSAPTLGRSNFEGQPHRGLSVPSTQPIFVATKDGPQLRGDTVNLSALEFKTLFGPVSIPVSTIEGVRMADDPRQPATICLTNGDSLTGVLTTDSVTIKTAWGGATIGRDHIVSIVTTSEPVTWQQLDGRWKITVVKPPESEADPGDAYESGEAEAADQVPVLDSAGPTTTSVPDSFQSFPEPGTDSP